MLGLLFLEDKYVLRGMVAISKFLFFSVPSSFWIIDLPVARQKEIQADLLAAETVGKEEVANFLGNFKANGTGKYFWSEFPFGTHPPISKRIELINSLKATNQKADD